MLYGSPALAQEPHDRFSVCVDWVPQKAYPLISLGFTFAFCGNTTGELKKGDQILSCSTLQVIFTSLFPFLFFYHQNLSCDRKKKTERHVLPCHVASTFLYTSFYHPFLCMLFVHTIFIQWPISCLFLKR